ncbi:MAG: mucoidy inhibitor MuiA family protein, partial [Clostridiales bacterium]|nr:mucoidy inhibitor MuiA family protein [Clostridiales bacterium]
MKKQKTESDNELYGSESEWMTEENYEIEVNSSVVKVTAYPKGALITRQAKVCLKKGRNLLRFTDLSDSIVPETLQIAMAEKISCSQVHYNPNKAKDSDENTVSAEPDELKNLRKEKVKLQNRMSSVKSVSEKLKNQELALSGNGFSAESTWEYIDFVTEKTTKLLDDISALEEKIQQIESQIADLEKDWNNQANASLTGVLNMATTVKADGDYKFELTYYDYKSEWTPHYDIHIKDLTSCAVFALKGSIQQYTGEDWENINLTFSTGNMQRSNNQPRLLPWFLNNHFWTGCSQPTARADTTTMLPNVFYDMEAEAINEQPKINWKAEEENTYSANETSLEFRISGNVSVTSRRRSADMIQILSAEHEASYFYSIIPKETLKNSTFNSTNHPCG